ncbi:DUF6680 family protein [Litorimonas haliclonae]|uniref:DUF6680 family protein n=1 Tax=Litorimonas haliclonae TaxID=2081977 RepID=UPI0039EE1A1C
MTDAEKINVTILVVTIIAIILGPVLAVWVTRIIDHKREKTSRKLNVFRALMRTRQARLSEEHVLALNLIELEFYGDKEVIKRNRNYIKHLSSPLPAIEEQDRYYNQRGDLFIELMKELGSNLGYDFDTGDLDRLGYAPKGWINERLIQQRNANLLTEVLEGRRPLPVANIALPPDNPFPPTPKIEK